MSVIVAIKENGVVYMGADTQTTSVRRKRNGLNEAAFKIVRFENGMLVGFCGKVVAKQTIISMKNVFFLDEEGKLDKRHIVKEIVPKLIDNIGLIGDEKSGTLNVSIMLAYKDKLYRITSNLDVLKLNEYGVIGSGLNYAHWCTIEKGDLSVRERILRALVASAKRTETVGGPYILIDTQKQEYEIIDMGGSNY